MVVVDMNWSTGFTHWQGLLLSKFVQTSSTFQPTKKHSRPSFPKSKSYHPHFEVGKTLSGIICDWSDTQLKGLEKSAGVEGTNQVVKGCQVRYILVWTLWSFDISIWSERNCPDELSKSETIAFCRFII